MKSKMPIFGAIIAVIILVYCALVVLNLEIQKDADQAVELSQNENPGNQANTGISSKKAHKNGIVEGFDIEKKYPRSSRITWLTDDNIKTTGINIPMIEGDIYPGGDIPFSLNIKSSDYRIENKFHAASLVLTVNVFERGYSPIYGYETNNYYLFFFGNRKTNKIEWMGGLTLRKKYPYFTSNWDFRFENQSTSSQKNYLQESDADN